MNDHPVTVNREDAVNAMSARGRDATNYWVQWWNFADAAWETMQLGLDREGASILYAKMAGNGGRVMIGADGASRIIMCTSPAYEAWAAPVA